MLEMLWSATRLIFKTNSVTPNFFYVFNLILSFSTCCQCFKKKSVRGNFWARTSLKQLPAARFHHPPTHVVIFSTEKLGTTSYNLRGRDYLSSSLQSTQDIAGGFFRNVTQRIAWHLKDQMTRDAVLLSNIPRWRHCRTEQNFCAAALPEKSVIYIRVEDFLTSISAWLLMMWKPLSRDVWRQLELPLNTADH